MRTYAVSRAGGGTRRGRDRRRGRRCTSDHRQRGPSGDPHQPDLAAALGQPGTANARRRACGRSVPPECRRITAVTRQSGRAPAHRLPGRGPRRRSQRPEGGDCPIAERHRAWAALGDRERDHSRGQIDVGVADGQRFRPCGSRCRRAASAARGRGGCPWRGRASPRSRRGSPSLRRSGTDEPQPGEHVGLDQSLLAIHDHPARSARSRRRHRRG